MATNLAFVLKWVATRQQFFAADGLDANYVAIWCSALVHHKQCDAVVKRLVLQHTSMNTDKKKKEEDERIMVRGLLEHLLRGLR